MRYGIFFVKFQLKRCHELESEVFEKDELVINLQKQIQDLNNQTNSGSVHIRDFFYVDET